MGLGYAATTPAAVKWFGPHRRGLVVGLVVGGYGGAAIYISPLAKFLIANYGISGSFIGLGIFFAAGDRGWQRSFYHGQIPTTGRRLRRSLETASRRSSGSTITQTAWSVPAMIRTWQF